MIANFCIIFIKILPIYSMDNLGAASLRSRRLESCFNTSYEPIKRETPKCSVDEQQIRRMERADFYVDDNGWSSVLISCFRIVTCFLAMMVTTSIWALIMLVLLPWPYQRIRQGNIYGHVTGRLLVKPSLLLLSSIVMLICINIRFPF